MNLNRMLHKSFLPGNPSRELASNAATTFLVRPFCVELEKNCYESTIFSFLTETQILLWRLQQYVHLRSI